jgi:hypothetical protein
MPLDAYDKALNHWIGLIRPFFPANAVFRAVNTGDQVCIVTAWLIGNNSEQRRLRKIEITLTDEAMNEYVSNDTPGSQRKADIRLKDLVAKKLNDSVVEIDTDSPNLTEKWVITNDLLNRQKA